MLSIRAALDSDRDRVWEIFREVVAAGDTFPFDPETSREEALAYWFQPLGDAYVAEVGDRVVGSYLLKPNQVGLGSHVANGAYMVAADRRGQGIGRALGEHSIGEAARLGYRALQFNLVVASNIASIRIWQALGFSTVGTLPGAFRHGDLGFVDAFVMFRSLADHADSPETIR